MTYTTSNDGRDDAVNRLSLRLFKGLGTGLLAFFMVCCFYSSPAHAAFTFIKNADTNFGTTSILTNSGSTNTIEMGTNGVISCAAGFTCPTTGTAMSFQISGANVGDLIQVDCDVADTLTNLSGSNGSNTLTVNAYRLRYGGQGLSGPGSGITCNGIGGTNSLSYTYSSIPSNNTIYVDVRLNAVNPKIGGVYSLSNTGNMFTISARRNGRRLRTITGDVFISFNSLVGFSSTGNIDFAKVGYSGAVNTSFVTLGTNGTASAAGNFTLNGVPTAGFVTMNNVQDGVTLEVHCDTSATMTNGAGASIQVKNIEVAAEGNTGAFGTKSPCLGSAGPAAATMVYTTGSKDQFYFGGKLDGSTATSFTGGNYSSANAGGTDITVIVLSQ